MNSLAVSNELNGILLNTPNRNEILNDGPPQNCRGNILGKGAYGIVLKAIFCDKPVAVKIVKNEERYDQQILRNESNIMGWHHRNIMRLLQIESTPKFGIIIMERFEGQCLQSILDSIHLPLKHCICISLDILAALSFCHKQGLLHLDVKPQNVFVSFEETRIVARARIKYICKLFDFGASTLLSDAQQPVVPGTVRYMSPEILCAGNLTAATDIYSVGITMWQLKYRQLPYYWIQCNDVVAYQVVKHQLRPDAKIALEQLGMCQCDFDRTASENSLYDLSHAAECYDRGLLSLNALQTCSKTHTKRVAYRELNFNGNINAATKFHRKTDKLHNIFYAIRIKNMHISEHKYKNLYQRSWHTNAHCRPNIVELCNKLANI